MRQPAATALLQLTVQKNVASAASGSKVSKNIQLAKRLDIERLFAEYVKNRRFIQSLGLVIILDSIPLISTHNSYEVTEAELLRLIGGQETRALLCYVASVAFVTLTSPEKQVQQTGFKELNNAAAGGMGGQCLNLQQARSSQTPPPRCQKVIAKLQFS